MKESELQRSPKIRDEGLLPLYWPLLSTRAGSPINSLLSLGQTGATRDSLYLQRILKGAITSVCVISVPTYNRISDLS